jgi:hypothetical protein
VIDAELQAEEWIHPVRGLQQHALLQDEQRALVLRRTHQTHCKLIPIEWILKLHGDQVFIELQSISTHMHCTAVSECTSRMDL